MHDSLMVTPDCEHECVSQQAIWLQAVAACKQRMRARQWHQAQLLRAVVHAWEDHTLYKLERQRLKRKATRHRSFTLLCHCPHTLPYLPPTLEDCPVAILKPPC